ncbi:MAG: hypothetical protein FK734_07335, partial [Asgard group archaeon]|nr:hypothetical protein [Asgard group archaeon]
MRKNRSNLVNEKISEITISPELKAKVMTLINNYKQQDPGLIEEIANEVLYIPVENGEVKVFHIKPENPTTKRPILFMPGWGNTTINFIDVYEILYNRAEFYYFETREKGSSKLNRWKANMTLSQKAKDLVKVIKYL